MNSRPEKPSPPSSGELFESTYVRPRAGRTLIVGSQIYGGKEDRRLRYADAVGVDMQDGPGVDRVIDLEEPLPEDLGLFDHVECMSVLEHSKRPWLMAYNLEKLMSPGATIFVTVPFVWRFHGYPHDYWRMTPEALPIIFPTVDWEARAFVSTQIHDGNKIKALKKDGHPYMSRTETFGFGVRR